MSTDIAVIGAGAFGTALASVVARRGDPVFLLGRDADTMAEIQESRLHAQKLPESKLPEPLQATVDRNCLAGARTVLLAVPAQHLREAIRTYREAIAPEADLVVCAKGIEQATGLFLADVVHAELGDRTVALLSGPGFAADIVRGLPTAMTLASEDVDAAERIAARLSGNAFRLYASTDVTGVEIGGSLKNVLAIACGIVEGRGFGRISPCRADCPGSGGAGPFQRGFWRSPGDGRRPLRPRRPCFDGDQPPVTQSAIRAGARSGHCGKRTDGAGCAVVGRRLYRYDRRATQPRKRHGCADHDGCRADP